MLLQKGSLEATLRDIEMRYNMELEKLNIIILRVQEELTQIRTDIQQSSRDYEHLLDIKVKLEAEIAEYRRLLEGGDLKWVSIPYGQGFCLLSALEEHTLSLVCSLCKLALIQISSCKRDMENNSLEAQAHFIRDYIL